MRARCRRAGLRPVPIFVTSLKDERSAAFVRAALAAHPPDVIVNATAFATASSGTGPAALAGASTVRCCRSRSPAHRAPPGRRRRAGSAPRDLAMHVVLPEVDGRIFANAIAFKERVAERDGGFAPTVALPLADRVDAAADLAAAWVALRRTPAPERRIAIVLANYPEPRRPPRQRRRPRHAGEPRGHHRGAARTRATTSATRRDDRAT